MDIVGYIPKTAKEWNGKMASVAYTPGCNFACKYCFSYPLFVNPAKVKLISIREYFEAISPYLWELQGVVVSGGEPTLQGRRLERFLYDCKANDLDTKVESNGSNPLLLQDLIEKDILDCISIDLKAPLVKEQYEQAIQSAVSLPEIHQSIDLLKRYQNQLEGEVSLVVHPQLISIEQVREIALSLDGVRKVVLKEFIPDSGTLSDELRNLQRTSFDYLAEAAEAISNIPEVRIHSVKGEEITNQSYREIHLVK